ncbi:MAG: hypothetical protein M1826_003315 [Phylliscum demangeonii]|nr:MAG: hypothetical protein M1826_003315 [Phylliscum demangeonii]
MYESLEPTGEGLWCPIVGKVLLSSQMRAAHIFPYRLGSNVMVLCFSKSSADEIMSPKNGLMISSELETKSDQYLLVIVPVTDAESSTGKIATRWQTRVLDHGCDSQPVKGAGPPRPPAPTELCPLLQLPLPEYRMVTAGADNSRNDYASSDGHHTSPALWAGPAPAPAPPPWAWPTAPPCSRARPSWGELDKRKLVFPSDYRPAARSLYFHYVISPLYAKRLGRKGWAQAGTTAEKMWATPGPYLRTSMLRALALHFGHDTDLPRAVTSIFLGRSARPGNQESEAAQAMVLLTSKKPHHQPHQHRPKRRQQNQRDAFRRQADARKPAFSARMDLAHSIRVVPMFSPTAEARKPIPTNGDSSRWCRNSCATTEKLALSRSTNAAGLGFSSRRHNSRADPFVCKGAVTELVPAIQHEEGPYNRLRSVHGQAVPASLGMIDLVQASRLVTGVRIAHVILMDMMWLGIEQGDMQAAEFPRE